MIAWDDATTAQVIVLVPLIVLLAWLIRGWWK